MGFCRWPSTCVCMCVEATDCHHVSSPAIFQYLAGPGVPTGQQVSGHQRHLSNGLGSPDRNTGTFLPTLFCCHPHGVSYVLTQTRCFTLLHELFLLTNIFTTVTGDWRITTQENSLPLNLLASFSCLCFLPWYIQTKKKSKRASGTPQTVVIISMKTSTLTSLTSPTGKCAGISAVGCRVHQTRDWLKQTSSTWPETGQKHEGSSMYLSPHQATPIN